MVCMACAFEHRATVVHDDDSEDTNSDDDVPWPTMASSDFVADSSGALVWRRRAEPQEGVKARCGAEGAS